MWEMDTAVEQRSAEWHALRVGKVTASRVSDVIAKTKSGYSASRANYLAELVAERLTGEPYEQYVNADMMRGVELEDRARECYEIARNVIVDKVGFVPHPDIQMAGASPDGLVGSDGLVEIKCPKTATHIKYIRDGKVPRDYFAQMQWQMDCTGRRWCDFVSYDPRMPEHRRLFVFRVVRDDGFIAEVRDEVQRFLAEVEEVVEELR